MWGFDPLWHKGFVDLKTALRNRALAVLYMNVSCLDREGMIKLPQGWVLHTGWKVWERFYYYCSSKALCRAASLGMIYSSNPEIRAVLFNRWDKATDQEVIKMRQYTLYLRWPLFNYYKLKDVCSVSPAQTLDSQRMGTWNRTRSGWKLWGKDIALFKHKEYSDKQLGDIGYMFINVQ